MRPVIAITANFGEKGAELAKGYYLSILQAGGSPVIVPPYEDMQALESLLHSVDGILLSGGADLNPLLVGEEPIPQLHGINAERDVPELRLIRRAYEMQIPMLGICRGIQMLAAALGGSIYQDLGAQYNDSPLLKHSQDLARDRASHSVSLSKGSLLESLFSGESLSRNTEGLLSLPVNSFHHQAVRSAGPLFHIAARAQDGVIEAIESAEYKSILGVQWHPECFILGGDRSHMPLFRWLVTEAENFAQTKYIHSRIVTLDSHEDTPMKYHTEEERLVTLPRMRDGRLDSSVMVAYLPQGERTPEALAAATAKAGRILTEIEEHVVAHSSEAGLARTPEDIFSLKQEGKRAIMLGIENGYAIGLDISRVEHFRRRGVVYMTLCHNGDNDICDSARRSLQEHNGVSPFGAQVIREMNRTGMMVDLSHASEKSFYDALELSATPIFCSHSCCKSLCPHPRNLSDAQMMALARRGGVMQVTMYSGFLRDTDGASIADVVEHINHAVNIMGIEHVGIGTDMDGDGGVPGVAHAGELLNLTRALLRERYSEHDLQLLWGGNFLRLMRLCQDVPDSPFRSSAV